MSNMIVIRVIYAISSLLLKLHSDLERSVKSYVFAILSKRHSPQRSTLLRTQEYPLIILVRSVSVT